MQAYVTQIGLVMLVLFAGLVYVILRNDTLAKRITALEQKVAALTGAPGRAPLASAEPVGDARPQTPVSEPAAPAAAERAGPWTGRIDRPVPAAAATDDVAMSAPALQDAPPDRPPKAVVFTASRLAELADWVRDNWIYVVSAISLALAGLFLVEYGIEIGLLTPPVRVLAGLVVGGVFVVGGEYLRRRWGDRPEVATAYLPSVFSGAGIVVLFGAVLAALHLYALISPAAALAGLVLVALLAVGLGWYSGPLLAALGLIGAFGAPFLVGGESDYPEVFYGYFGLIAIVGLAIDAGRRWAWVSVLALALAFPAASWLYIGIGQPEYYAALVVALVAASMAIPPLRLMPAHAGAATIDSFAKKRPRGWPAFPTRLAAGAMVAATAALLFLAAADRQGLWIAAIGLAGLFVATTIWAARARALEDLAALPAAALVLLPAIERQAYGARIQAFWVAARDATDRARAAAETLTEDYGTETVGNAEFAVPLDPYWLVALAGLFTLAAAWRSWHGARWPVAWAAGAALVTPAMIAVLEIGWAPARGLTAYGWAIAAISAAVLMTLLALAFAPRDGDSRPRVAGFALAAIALIAFSLTLLLTETALTLALAVTTLAAAALDRRFGLRPISVAVQAGAVILSYRLIFDPGLDRAWRASYPEMIAVFGGSVAALAAALWLYRPMTRPQTKIVAESAAWSLAAIFASTLLARLIDEAVPGDRQVSHWAFGLQALIWIAAATAQIWRLGAGGALRRVRLVLAWIYSAVAALTLFVAVTFLNPVADANRDNAVLGPPLSNTLFLAYAAPALAISYLVRRFPPNRKWIRWPLAGSAGALAALWLFLVIRHFWRGADIDAAGFTEPELYTYTMALLVTGAALLWQAIAKRAPMLRKLGMAVIALTIAKVFLVDMSGLVGLLRVFSFLALGLSLAGLAFLNRWAAGQIAEAAGDGDEAP